MSAPTMRAIVAPSPGPPEALELREVPRPVPGPGEVLIRVAVAGVNPIDAKTRVGGGAAPFLQPGPASGDGDLAFPWIPGWDAAGTVAAVGPGVVRFGEGDRVFGMIGFPRTGGTYAEHVVAPVSHLSRSPRSLDDAATVALALPGLTAWQALVDAGGLETNQRVLVTAAAGGVGHLAVQIAVDLGAHVVAVASAAGLETLRATGAELRDRHDGDPLAGLEPFDLVVDGVGGAERARAAATLRPGGTIVTLPSASHGDPLGRDDVRAPRLLVAPDGLELQLLTGTVERGMLRPRVADRLPLADAAEAHRRIEAGGVHGKLVLDVG